MKTNGLSAVSSSEREAEDDQFCGMQYGNTECSDDSSLNLHDSGINPPAGKNQLLFREKENRNGSGCLCSFLHVHWRSDE